MNHSELDKSYGLAVWHDEDYLELIWKLRKRASWTPKEIPGIDYVPYENVLPNEARFEAEYAALPSGQRVELTGELLKEAKSWGLSAAWPDKTDFVRAVRKCRKDSFAIQARQTRLKKAVEAIRHRLRTPDNHKTIAAFVAHGRRGVALNTQALSRAVARGGLPFLPNVDLDAAAHYGVIHPKTVPTATSTEEVSEAWYEDALSHEVPETQRKKVPYEGRVLFSIAKRDVCLEPPPQTFARRQPLRRPAREEGLLRRVWRFLFGA